MPTFVAQPPSDPTAPAADFLGLTSPSSDVAVDPLVMFAHALQSQQPLSVLLTGDDAPPATLPPQPFAVLGRNRGCDITLADRTVSQRHLYLQVFRDRVFACDLFSANGLRLKDAQGKPQRFAAGWLSADDVLRIGSTTLQAWATGDAATPPAPLPALADGQVRKQDEPPSPLEFKPRKEDDPFFGMLPRAELELSTGGRDAKAWPINRIVTLLGRSDACRITCSDPSISSVHCALVLTPAGIWAVDLVSRTGLAINGDATRCGLLVAGHELQVGKYKLRASYERSESPPAAPAAPAIARGRGPDVAFATKNHRVFKTETAAPVLLVGDASETVNASAPSTKLSDAAARLTTRSLVAVPVPVAVSTPVASSNARSVRVPIAVVTAAANAA